MKKIINIICFLAVIALLLTGCPSSGDPDEKTFSISGKFTKSGDAGSGDVIFKLANRDNYNRAPAGPSRVITNESYLIEGELQDGALTIKLKGSYDPIYFFYTVSADTATSPITPPLRYIINGGFDDYGNFTRAEATLLRKDDWRVFTFPVSATSATITGTAVDSDEPGIPDFALGLWSSSAMGFEAQCIMSPYSYLYDEVISYYDDLPDYISYDRFLVKVIDNTDYYDFIVAYIDNSATKYEKCKVVFSKGNTRMSITNYSNNFSSVAAAEAATALEVYSKPIFYR